MWVERVSEKWSFPRHTFKKHRPRSTSNMNAPKSVRDYVTEFFRIVELRNPCNLKKNGLTAKGRKVRKRENRAEYQIAETRYPRQPLFAKIKFLFDLKSHRYVPSLAVWPIDRKETMCLQLLFLSDGKRKKNSSLTMREQFRLQLMCLL